ncbi:MAG: hypothetical protein HDR34_01350 [Treponema sp.]|nr:hypothetical protein [Treponema sp.]
MYDYYRGSSSYEDAVRRQLTELETTSLANTHAINSNLRNGFQTVNDRFQENNDIMRAGFGATLAKGAEIENNMMAGFGTITNEIQDMSLGMNCTIRESTYTVVASQAMLARTFKQGFNAVNNMLDLGFSRVNSKLDAMTDRFCSNLDKLHDTLKNPLFTASQELYRRAIDNCKKGLYEEAMEDFIGAVEKNKTDFFSWYFLGLIYLRGVGKFCYVIDIDKAEEAFFNAAKYIDYALGKSEEGNMYGSEFYYCLGLARLTKSNDLLVEKKIAESKKKLEEAEKASREAYHLDNKNLLALYELAKEVHFLGRDDEALRLIEKLIRTDKNYALRACNDKNFESLWDRIDNLVKTLRDELADKLVKEFTAIRTLGKMGNELLTDIKFPDEEQIREFERFYHSELMYKEFETDETLMQIIYNDFDELAKGKNLYIEDVINCKWVIQNVRNERLSWNIEFNKIESNVELEIGQIESILKKENDYFSVRDKYSNFCGSNDNSPNFTPQRDKLTTMIHHSLKNFHEKYEELKNNVKTLQSYIDAQHKWDKNKLRDEYKDEITREWREIHNSWQSRICELRQQLSYKDFDEKSALEIELNTMESRLEEVFGYFGNLQGDDYYSIVKKYKKLKKDNFLQNSLSYFEWSLSELNEKIKGLRNASNK